MSVQRIRRQICGIAAEAGLLPLMLFTDI